MNIKWYAWAALPVLMLAGCGDDDPTPPPAPETLVLSFTGLDPMTNGFHYEGWVIVGGSAISTGKFNVDAGGALVGLDGGAISGGAFETGTDLSTATAVIITIEPSGDTDVIPAATHIVGGSVANASAALTVGAPQALGNDFLAATGSYILSTPTNGDDNDENSGLWFLSLASGAPGVGLDLPTLPAGWAYEGWAVIGGMPVTTGRFTSLSTVDDADPFSGPDGGPPFPGEDFLINAPNGLVFPTDLAGATAVISIEPEPDDAATPFTLKPLVSGIPADAVDHVTYDLSNNAGGYPTGTATIR